MKLIILILVITSFSCMMPKGTEQFIEEPARLIKIDTNYRRGDMYDKTLHYEFLRHREQADIQGVPLWDARKVGSIKLLQRPLTSLNKIVTE